MRKVSSCQIQRLVTLSRCYQGHTDVPHWKAMEQHLYSSIMSVITTVYLFPISLHISHKCIDIPTALLVSDKREMPPSMLALFLLSNGDNASFHCF